MVITQAGRYEIKGPTGSIERDLRPIGVYELPAETEPLAYTTLVKQIFKHLDLKLKIEKA